MSEQSVNSRLDQSSHGTPKLNPDEQRKYLGTFRERVSLAIKIKEMASQHALDSFKREIQKNPNYQVILNGRINQNLTAPYLAIANQNNVKFVIKTDSFYFTHPDSYGLVYASPSQAINQYPVDINQKYPTNQKKHPTKKPTKQTHYSIFDKIKSWFK